METLFDQVRLGEMEDPAYHVQQNQKRSLSVDLTTSEGISLIEDLIPKVDIVVEKCSRCNGATGPRL